jgi:hypothetical protein
MEEKWNRGRGTVTCFRFDPARAVARGPGRAWRQRTNVEDAVAGPAVPRTSSFDGRSQPTRTDSLVSPCSVRRRARSSPERRLPTRRARPSPSPLAVTTISIQAPFTRFRPLKPVVLHHHGRPRRARICSTTSSAPKNMSLTSSLLVVVRPAQVSPLTP